MDKQKSVELCKCLDILTKHVKKEIEMLETETINWRKELEDVLEDDPLIALDIDGVLYEGNFIEIGLKQLEREFDPSYGNTEGASFCAWSQNLVIFTEEEDGHQWLRTINRNPQHDEEKEIK